MTDKTSTYISPEFKESMANFAQGMAKQGDHLRHIKSMMEALEQSIRWNEARLEKLEKDSSRKQHHKHKAEIKYQIRRAEIELAFFRSDWTAISPSIKKFYGY